jgi:hypothetical protein
MLRAIAIASLATTAILSGPLARAESPEDAAFATQVFGKAPGDKPTSVCFSRVYDDTHLSTHPQQNVRTMHMIVTSRVEEGNRTYELRLGVNFKNSKRKFETSGSCGSTHGKGEDPKENGTVHCGVDCDGGGIDVALRDSKSLRVAIPAGARLYRAGSNDGPPTNGRKNFGSDDKLFRLDRANFSECLPMVHGAEDRKQLGVK